MSDLLPIEREALEETRRVLEARELERMWVEELECQAHHEAVGITCSGKVTHGYRSCVPGDRVICAKAASYVRSGIASERAVCGECLGKCFDHWRVWEL